MSSKFTISAFLLIIFTLIASRSSGHEAKTALGLERRLQRMIGFTIVAATTVDRVLEDKRDRKKILILSDGTAFTSDDPLWLDPLPLSDVIVFAKAFPKDLREKFKELPEKHLFYWRIAVDGDVYEVTPR